MGLIKAALGAAGGVLAEQWKEYFYCESLPENVLAVKGKKRVSGNSSNTSGSENIISNGSVIAECGNKKPAGVPQLKRDKCGWEPEKDAKIPKFCPECGDPFDDGDLVY